MNKKVVFEVELINGNYYAGLNLPATDYELLDALDRLRMQPQDTPEWELTYYEGFSELAGIIEKAGDIYEINALAKVMAEYDYMQEASFEALLKNEIWSGCRSAHTNRMERSNIRIPSIQLRSPHVHTLLPV